MSQLIPLRDEISAVAANAENRLISLNESLVNFIEAKQSQTESALAENAHQQSTRITEIRQSVDTIRRQLGAGSQPLSAPASTRSQEITVIDDALYVALENHFRGSRDLIAQRQSDYLPLLPSVINSSTPLIDLGCGRGEWLKVLKERQIPAIGVDSNAVCIAECQEEQLEVIASDLLDFLNNRPDNSVGAFTLFQVLEHLPFPILVEVLREMRRALVSGGLIIAEVPNAKNLRVSSGTFWIDPTHQRPLFPELLIFLAIEVGFSKADGIYTNNLSPDHDLTGLPDGARDALRSVVDAIDGPSDFALIATA